MVQQTNHTQLLFVLEAGSITALTVIANQVQPLTTKAGAFVCGALNATAFFDKTPTILKITALAAAILLPTYLPVAYLGPITVEATLQFTVFAAFTKVTFYALTQLGIMLTKNPIEEEPARLEVEIPPTIIEEEPPVELPEPEESSTALKVSLLALAALATVTTGYWALGSSQSSHQPRPHFRSLSEFFHNQQPRAWTPLDHDVNSLPMCTFTPPIQFECQPPSTNSDTLPQNIFNHSLEILPSYQQEIRQKSLNDSLPMCSLRSLIQHEQQPQLPKPASQNASANETLNVENVGPTPQSSFFGIKEVVMTSIGVVGGFLFSQSRNKEDEINKALEKIISEHEATKATLKEKELLFDQLKELLFEDVVTPDHKMFLNAVQSILTLNHDVITQVSALSSEVEELKNTARENEDELNMTLEEQQARNKALQEKLLLFSNQKQELKKLKADLEAKNSLVLRLEKQIETLGELLTPVSKSTHKDEEYEEVETVIEEGKRRTSSVSAWDSSEEGSDDGMSSLNTTLNQTQRSVIEDLFKLLSLFGIEIPNRTLDRSMYLAEALENMGETATEEVHNTTGNGALEEESFDENDELARKIGNAVDALKIYMMEKEVKIQKLEVNQTARKSYDAEYSEPPNEDFDLDIEPIIDPRDDKIAELEKKESTQSKTIKDLEKELNKAKIAQAGYSELQEVHIAQTEQVKQLQRQIESLKTKASKSNELALQHSQIEKKHEEELRKIETNLEEAITGRTNAQNRADEFEEQAGQVAEMLEELERSTTDLEQATNSKSTLIEQVKELEKTNDHLQAQIKYYESEVKNEIQAITDEKKTLLDSVVKLKII